VPWKMFELTNKETVGAKENCALRKFIILTLRLMLLVYTINEELRERAYEMKKYSQISKHLDVRDHSET
jgi:hypothetical protein